MKIINGITTFGRVDSGAFEQIQNCVQVNGVIGAALMADNHKGYSAPVGSVIVVEPDMVVPAWVGYDIACGIRASRTDVQLDKLPDGFLAKFAAHIYDNVVSFGIGRKNNTEVWSPLFDNELWKHEFFAPLKQKAMVQLGTVGSGNHFVDFLSDEDGYLWIMAHFGSRGFGHAVASGFLNLGEGKRFSDKVSGEKEGIYPVAYRTNTELGSLYWDAMSLAGEYAYAGRNWVVDTIANELGSNVTFTVHNHHNFAWRESHFGDDVIVIRKGATPLDTESCSVVGGSMADMSAVIRGVSTEDYLYSFRSAMHGAGRVMSRTEAAGKLNYKTRERSGGKISRNMMYDALNEYGVYLLGGGTDESPFVYQKLQDVLDSHSTYVKNEITLYPRIVLMAGNEYDPYKD